jgi:hypothetical protein
MPKREAQLIEEERQFAELYSEAQAAEKNVRILLDKADAHRGKGDDRHWRQIVDNLENALDRARSSVTAYEQQLKEKQHQLKQLRETGRIAPTEEALNEAAACDVYMPKTMLPAERILAMPLTELSSLTLDEVSAIHDQLVEEMEQLVAPEVKAPEPAPRKSVLQERIERAQEARKNLAAGARPTAPTLLERRRQVALREAVKKITVGNMAALTLEEVEVALDSYGRLTVTDLGEADARLKKFFESHLDGIKERLAEFRRRDMQKLTR